MLIVGSRALHPPAGVDAFLIAQLDLPWSWIVNPVLIGAILLAGFSQIWAWGGSYLSVQSTDIPKGTDLSRSTFLGYSATVQNKL